MIVANIVKVKIRCTLREKSLKSKKKKTNSNVTGLFFSVRNFIVIKTKEMSSTKI
jgi:hypothetical protein